MKQKRNLIFNIFFNIAFIALLIYFNFIITSDKPNLGGLITLIIVEISLLSFFLSVIQGEFSVFVITPPIGIFTLTYLLIEYLKGKVKWIKSEYGSHIARYDEDKIKIYKFKLLSYCRVEDIKFDGSEESIKSVHEYFKSIEDKKIAIQENRSQRLKKNNKFKEWDGTLDTKTKRINTIDKIIK